MKRTTALGLLLLASTTFAQVAAPQPTTLKLGATAAPATPTRPVVAATPIRRVEVSPTKPAVPGPTKPVAAAPAPTPAAPPAPSKSCMDDAKKIYDQFNAASERLRALWLEYAQETGANQIELHMQIQRLSQTVEVLNEQYQKKVYECKLAALDPAKKDANTVCNMKFSSPTNGMAFWNNYLGKQQCWLIVRGPNLVPVSATPKPDFKPMPANFNKDKWWGGCAHAINLVKANCFVLTKWADEDRCYEKLPEPAASGYASAIGKCEKLEALNMVESFGPSQPHDDVAR